MSALIVANEDRIKRTFAEHSVIADVHIGFWQPYPSNRQSDPERLLADRAIESHQIPYLLKPGERHFARINIQNKGVSDVKSARLQTGGRQSDILVVDNKNAERTFFNDVEDVQIPTIPAGGSIEVYMWSIHDMDSIHILADLRIFNDSGAFLIKYVRDRDIYSVYTDQPGWIKFLGEWLPIILFILLFFGLLGAMLVGALWETYVKKLLKDDGFYINEKIRHDANPKTFKPDMESPKSP